MRPVVALTGGTGFLGSHIVRALADAGYRVRLLTRRTPLSSFFADIPVEAVIGDLHDRRAVNCLLDGASGVIHAAGIVKALHDGDFFSINRDGTHHIVEALNQQKTPIPLTLISSLAARSPALSPYAASKREAEEIVAAQARFPWVVLRPPAIYGPGDTELLPLFRVMAKGLFVQVGPATSRLSFIHVRDAASAAVTSIAQITSLNGTRHELSDPNPEGYGWAEIAHCGEMIFQRRLRRLGVPRWVLALNVAGRQAVAHLTGHPDILGWGKYAEINHGAWVSQRSDFIEKTSWKPLFGLEAGFKDTRQWYQENGWLPDRTPHPMPPQQPRL